MPAILRSCLSPLRLLTGLGAGSRVSPLVCRRYGTGSDSHHRQEQYNEPGGYLFGRRPGERLEMDTTTRLYVVFYLGGLAVFLFLYQYKPETEYAALRMWP